MSTSARPSRIFVTGGSGFVGGHLIPALLAAGHSVRALARSEASAARVEALGAEVVRGELGRVSVDDLCGVDAVVHAAAKAEDWGDWSDFEAVHVHGTRQLLEAARAAGVPRLVHLSTEAVLFRGDDLVDVDENAPLALDSPFAYPATKARAEQLVRDANSAELATIVLRPRLIWGPGDTTVLPVVARAAADGAFAWIDGGGQRTSTTHVHNLVDAILVALDRAPGGLVAFIVDAETHTTRSFLTAYLRAAGVDLPDRSVPGWAMRAAAGGLAWVWRLLGLRGRPPVSPLTASMLSATVTIRSSVAADVLGWEPVVDHATGLRAVAAASAS